jgi:hypothetical protein
VLQLEEVERGEWVPWEALDEFMTGRTFCPDGLEVLAAYRARAGG